MLNSPLSEHASELVIAILNQVLTQGAPLERAYSKPFAPERRKPWEHARIALVTGDILRRLSYYSFLADVAAEQIEREGTRLINAWHMANGLELPKMRYALQMDSELLEQRMVEAQSMPALLDGCPQWLEALGSEQLGDNWPAERHALTQAPKRYLRTNLLKCSREELKARLAKEGVETCEVPEVGSALEVISDSALFRTECFKSGWFEQQDAGSQHVAEALGVEPGMRVIDACAGAGGKTLHLAAKMQGKGRLLAMDVEQWKLDNLKQRARRAGAHNVETRLIASSKTIKRLKLSADRVLLDVPCSGLGVLKRNPDTKWRDTPERLPVLMELQEHILGSYSRMVKVGGILVYATCSIMPQENEQQVARFLKQQSHFRLLDEETISPAKTGFDGFYLARIERIAE